MIMSFLMRLRAQIFVGFELSQPVIAPDLGAGRCRRYVYKRRTCGDESETTGVSRPDTDLAKTTSFALIKDKEHTKHEAKEHDLSLVRQGRA